MATFSFGRKRVCVPEDVLYEIFKLAMPDIDMSSPTTTHYGQSRDQAPMSLMQTCQSWRRVAQTSPLLWNRIYFKLKDSESPGEDVVVRVLPSLEFLQFQLSLTSDAVLRIHGSGGYLSKGSQSMDQVFDLIFPTFPRWKSAYLSLPDISFARLEKYGIGTGAPNLVSLCMKTLNATQSEGPDTTVLPIQLWSDAPRLQHLAVNFSLDAFEGSIGTSPWKHDFLSRMPFGQLTFLELGGATDESISIPELHRILDSCSSRLVTGRFSSVCTSASLDDALFTVSPVNMPCLENLLLSLCIADENYDEDERPDTELVSGLSIVLHNLVKAPRLSSLSLQNDPFLDIDYLVKFIKNSQCEDSLETLDLLNSGTQSENLDKLLSALPSLKGLHHFLKSDARFFTTNTSITSHLTRWNHQTRQFTLCPRLEEMTCDYDSAIESETELFFYTMIKARLGNGIPACKPNLKILRLTSVPPRCKWHTAVLAWRNLDLYLTSNDQDTNFMYNYARLHGTYRFAEGRYYLCDHYRFNGSTSTDQHSSEMGFGSDRRLLGEYDFVL